ncbi:head-tail connector protein [Zavarzinia sp.]|uniref:head-tail connector protein n=1 Tax=Zavarzinia sp. TaxID=2027920 RepID=UPI003568F29F
MALLRLTAPAADLLTVEDAKAQLRVEVDDEDALIGSYIKAATARLDGPAGLLGRALVTQQWRLTLPSFLPAIPLPLPPCQLVETVTYEDATRTIQTLDSTTYRVDGAGGDDAAVLIPTDGTPWPAGSNVTVDFTAGYGDTAEDVPEGLRQAVRLLVGHWHRGREAVVIGSIVNDLPFGFEDLIRDYRLWSF